LLKNSAQSFKPMQTDMHITIHLSHDVDYFYLHVEDNGQGMEESVRARAFEPFFSTHPTEDARGLGLTIAYNIIVEGHQGSITLDSTLGKGTKVKITLPLNKIK